jgi:glucose dehydrogenase
MAADCRGKTMKSFLAVAPLVAFIGIASCSRAVGRPAETTDATLREAEHDTANWLMYKRTYDDHRFSPLNEINEQSPLSRLECRRGPPAGLAVRLEIHARGF